METKIKLEDGTVIDVMLYDADPNCDHEEDPKCWSGIRCIKCGGWDCY